MYKIRIKLGNLYSILLILCSTLSHTVFAQELPAAFVDVTNIIPGIQIDIRYFGENNFVGRRIDGYKSPRCLMTKNTAKALKKVQQDLQAFGLALKIFDAYRPQSAVDHFVRWAKNINDVKMKQKYYPGVTKKNLFTDGYIAEKSGHSRGSTVDVTLISIDDGEIKELDMGTGWDFFGPESWPSNTSVSKSQGAHRMLLQSIMVKHGFKPLKEEWWHFTLVDEPFPETYFNFPIEPN